MSRDIAPLGLRMPTELKSKIEEAAHENGRSMNAEIIDRLNESFASLIDNPFILIEALIQIYEEKGIPISITIGDMESVKNKKTVKTSGA